MAAQVGLDPDKDIDWVTDPKVKPKELFIDGKIDGFLGCPPKPQELRGRGIGIVKTSATTRGRRITAACWAAKRIESGGLAGRIHVSAATRRALGDTFRFEPRGWLGSKARDRWRPIFLLGTTDQEAAPAAAKGRIRRPIANLPAHGYITVTSRVYPTATDCSRS